MAPGKLSFIVQPFRRAATDPLYRSAVALVVNTGINSLTGFIFWTLAAHRAEPRDIGLVTTTVSLTVLFGTLGTLGLPNALIRQLLAKPSRSRATFVGAVLVTQLATLIVVSLAWLTPLRPPLGLQHGGALAVVLVYGFMQLSVLSMIVDSSLLALGRPTVIVLKNALAGLVRIGLVLIPFANSHNAEWLLTIQVFGAAIAVSVGATALLVRELVGPVAQPLSALRGVWRYSLGNAAGMAAGILPTTATPAIVLALLGRKEAAYFGISLMILGLVSVVAAAASQSMYAETQRGVEGTALLVKAARGIALTLIPVVLVGLVAAPIVLSVFGHEYADAATPLLRWMVVASLPAAVSYLADAYVNGRGDSRGYLLLNVQNSAWVLGLIFIGAQHGLTGVGLSWFVAQAISAAVACCYALMKSGTVT